MISFSEKLNFRIVRGLWCGTTLSLRSKLRFLKVADAVYYVNESWSVMFFLDNFKENCQRNRLISNLNAFTCFCGINSVKIIENNRLGNGEKSQISTQIKSHVSWVRFRLVAHQTWDISGEAEFVSLSLRFNLSKSQVGGPRPWSRSFFGMQVFPEKNELTSLDLMTLI